MKWFCVQAADLPIFSSRTRRLTKRILTDTSDAQSVNGTLTHWLLIQNEDRQPREQQTIKTMPEIFFAPTKASKPISLHDLHHQFLNAGISCKVNQDTKETSWIIFDTHKSTIYASIAKDVVTFLTFNFDPFDTPQIVEITNRVMERIGFSDDEQADYA